MKPLHLAFLLLINLVWALNMVAMKEAVTLVPPVLATALRFAIVLAACAMALRLVPGRMRLVLATAAVTGALQFGLISASYHVATNLSALAIAAQAGVPLSLLLAVLVDGERIAWRRTLGILLAMGGVGLIAFDPRIANERLAVLLVVGASACWAVGNLLFKRLAGVPIATLFAWQGLVSLPLLVLASALFEPGAIARLPAMPVAGLLWIAYTAIAASLVGHAGMSWLLQRYPVSTITPLTLATPLLSVAVVTLVYGTPITPGMVAGGLMTLLGVAIIALRSARSMPAPLPARPEGDRQAP